MANSDSNPVYSALNQILGLWKNGNLDRVHQTDIRRLERLIESDKLQAFWQKAWENSPTQKPPIGIQLLLSELFHFAQPVPAWEAQTGAERRKRLEQIDRIARRLANLISDSPIGYLSEGAIGEMRLGVPPLSAGPGIRRVGEPDFLIALADLREQAAVLLEAAPVLRRPKHEDAHRRYFVLRTAQYLKRRFHTRSRKVVAELARIFLNDDSIDTEVVRKILDSTVAG